MGLFSKKKPVPVREAGALIAQVYDLRSIGAQFSPGDGVEWWLTQVGVTIDWVLEASHLMSQTHPAAAPLWHQYLRSFDTWQDFHRATGIGRAKDIADDIQFYGAIGRLQLHDGSRFTGAWVVHPELDLTDHASGILAVFLTMAATQHVADAAWVAIKHYVSTESDTKTRLPNQLHPLMDYGLERATPPSLLDS